MKRIIKFFENEIDGQAMVEYSLTIALIAIAVIGAVYAFGKEVFKLYLNASTPIPL